MNDIFMGENLDVEVKHLKGCGMIDDRSEDAGGLQGELEREVVWAGTEKGRGRWSCVILLPPRVWAGVKVH